MNNATASTNAQLTAFGNLLSSGTLVFYSGFRPATANTALSGNTALATFTFSATAFNSPTAYSTSQQYMQASFVTNPVTSTTSGTVSFARAYESGGSVAVADFSVATANADIVISNTAISYPGTVTMPSFYIFMANG